MVVGQRPNVEVSEVSAVPPPTGLLAEGDGGGGGGRAGLTASLRSSLAIGQPRPAAWMTNTAAAVDTDETEL